MKVIDISIPRSDLDRAAQLIQAQLGPAGIAKVGGRNWWQWRRESDPSLLCAEWIEMREDYDARKQKNKQKQKPKKQYEQRDISVETRNKRNGKDMRGMRQGISRKEQQPEEYERIMLYIHGGAYYFGSVDAHRYQIQRHARKLRARVLAPRYRLAPQFPFPCALQDCLAAYLYLIERHRPSTILLAGDSAGAGTIVSTLVILRDQGIPLPAGGILLSPWVDLTHSFPSLGEDDSRDYIPASGFMHKPSQSWPPFRPEELAVGMDASSKSSLKGSKQSQSTSRSSLLSFHSKSNTLEATPQLEEDVAQQDNKSTDSSPSQSNVARVSNLPTQTNEPLKITIDGKVVEITEQIQLYAPNHLLNHPLVSPILQPSLGGLPPLLIQVGGGELLRDEQIYLAHKAANPVDYPPSKDILDQYDPERKLLCKYEPTDVQLQVWDDMCHVPHTFSFSNSVKLMYKAVAQFGAWALLRAQQKEREKEDRHHDEQENKDQGEKNEKANASDNFKAKEDVNDHNLRSLDASEQPSGISTPELEEEEKVKVEVDEVDKVKEEKHSKDKETSTEQMTLNLSLAPPTPSPSSSPLPSPLPTQQKQTSNPIKHPSPPESHTQPQLQPQASAHAHAHTHTNILSATYPVLPPFTNHMLRQSVSNQGLIRTLPPPSELPALQLEPSDIGVVKDGPVLKRWLEAQKTWRARHGQARGEVLRGRVRELELDLELAAEAEAEAETESLRKRDRERGREKEKERERKEGTSRDYEKGGGEGGRWLGILGEGEIPPLSALVGRQGRGRDKSKRGDYEDSVTRRQEENRKEKEKNGMWGTWGKGWWNFW